MYRRRRYLELLRSSTSQNQNLNIVLLHNKEQIWKLAISPKYCQDDNLTVSHSPLKIHRLSMIESNYRLRFHTSLPQLILQASKSLMVVPRNRTIRRSIWGGVAPTITTANALCHPSTSPSKKVMTHSQVDKGYGNATCAGQVLTFMRPHPAVLSADTRYVVHARLTQKFHQQWEVAHSVAARIVRLHLASRVLIRMGTSVRPSQVQNHENISMQRQIVLRSAADPNLKRPAPNTTDDG
jgi:hypothetical protein